MAWTTPGTAVAGEVLEAAFWNEQVRDNLTELAPFFSSWVSYTPVLTGSVTNPNLGSTGSASGRYLRIGDTVIQTFSFVFGGSGISSGSGFLFVDFVVPASTTSHNNVPVGNVILLDNSPFRRYIATPILNTADDVSLIYQSDSSGAASVQAGTPITFAASDTIRGQLIFQAA